MAEILTRRALGDLLSNWLPRQRWFPGRGARAGGIEIISDVTLLDGDPRQGDPQLRHLIVEASSAGGPASFQVLLGVRRQLPASVAPDAVIGQLPGLVCYDALHDAELAAVLLRGIAGQRSAGPLRFVRESAALGGNSAQLNELGDSRLLTAEQSNTSLVFGEAAILKVLRRLFPGANPDLEVADALSRLGSARVAAPFGWIETRIDDEPVLLAVLSEFLAHASDGWTLATQGLGRLYARQAAYGQEYLTGPLTMGPLTQAPAPAGNGGSRNASAKNASAQNTGALPFVAEARELGEATAQMHLDMATAFGRRDMSPAELAALSGVLTAKLEDAVAVVPELGDHANRIAAAYDDVAGIATPVTLQRIHGDYHLGQVMYSGHGWVALDFEGEPAAPLAERRALAPALRDVAGMLRSFDYAARHRLVGHPDADALAATAGAWVAECQREFCAGYSAGGGADPNDQATLLRALTLEKAVYEVIYEYRHRPGWLPIPLDYVAVS